MKMYLDGVSVDQRPTAAQHGDARRAEHALVDAVEALYLLALVGHHKVPAHGGSAAHVPAKATRVGKICTELRGVHEQLLRHTPANDTPAGELESGGGWSLDE